MVSRVLVLNTGSSSVKFALTDGHKTVLRGQISGLPSAPELEARSGRSDAMHERLDGPLSADEAVLAVLGLIEERASGTTPDIVGHRVVHGGPFFEGPALVTTKVLKRITQLVPLAPLHQPAALEAIEAVERHLPGVPQMASFDTSFHRSQEHHVQLYALPEDYTRRGILRYGFHGLSYDHVASEVARLLPDLDQPRIVAAHLGSGASLCAIRGRQSVATSMGFSALDGLPMATRCGSLDPGALLFLIRQEGLDPDEVEQVLYREAGLRGMARIGTGDIREILKREEEPGPAQALAHFVHRISLGIGEMAAALNGMDVLVFTGGVGENAAQIRERVAAGLGYLGVHIDRTRNDQGRQRLEFDDSNCQVLVIPADEEAVIRRDAESILASRD
ncbi:acetate/propionate family kinase [Parvularcula sp. ZS-1/3]|uniref:Acetate kinase n=1 Tax=Parvularcula mediterranea TaxID=2732508 RepID=A0A7Y3RQK2_9PROT|nr:acetate/propionate family kinase [Parvularcula mediterranea]NNU17547.1 acetate/propionate family kinase [Parvularcula mediterranea]